MQLADEIQAANLIHTPVTEEVAENIARFRYGVYFYTKQLTVQGNPLQLLAYGSDCGIFGVCVFKNYKKKKLKNQLILL